MSDYKIKMKGYSHTHKLPFFCPNCSKITGTLDDSYLTDLGICAECFVLYVEDRKLPIIDLSKFAPISGLFYQKSKEEIDQFFLSRQK